MGRNQSTFVIGVCLVAMLALADASWAEKRLQLIGRFYGPSPPIPLHYYVSHGPLLLCREGTYTETFGQHCPYPLESREGRCMPPQDLSLLVSRRAEK